MKTPFPCALFALVFLAAGGEQTHAQTNTADRAFDEMQRQRAIQRNNELRELKRRIALTSPPPAAVVPASSGQSVIRVRVQPRSQEATAPKPEVPAPQSSRPEPVAVAEKAVESPPATPKRRKGAWFSPRKSQSVETPEELLNAEPEPTPAPEPQVEEPTEEQEPDEVTSEPDSPPEKTGARGGFFAKLFGSKTGPKSEEIIGSPEKTDVAATSSEEETAVVANGDSEDAQVLAAVGDWSTPAQSFNDIEPPESLLYIVTEAAEFFTVAEARVSDEAMPIKPGTVVMMLRSADTWNSVELATGEKGIIKETFLKPATDREAPAFYLARSEGVAGFSSTIETPMAAPPAESNGDATVSAESENSEVGFGLLPPES